MKKIFLIDNYDSFTYNLSHYLEDLGCDVTVKRNDMFKLDDINNYDGILISPGPGIPDEAGMTKDVIKKYKEKKTKGTTNNLGRFMKISPPMLKIYFSTKASTELEKKSV